MKHAFTLVELLIVLATIGLMLGLLLPGMSGARQTALGLNCQTNLRQMAVAAFAYSATFKECMPPALVYEWTASGVVVNAWDYSSGVGGVRPGALWGFCKDPGRVQQCPCFVGGPNSGQDLHTGYNYNTSFIGAEAPLPTSPNQCGWEMIRRGVPLTSQRRSSETALFGDGGWRNGSNKFMRAPSASVEGDLGAVYAGGQALRHQGGSEVAYLDGHVSCSRQCCAGTQANPYLLHEVMGFPRNGFLSEDDSAYDPR
ncbi:MAG: DUF1559 domain-containing protein [Phycisphaerales bacterium]|nr:DUF1559 domain-containing protein [Phycisphaerales bacterium]